MDLMQFVRTYPGAVDDALAADLVALSGGPKMDTNYRRCSITPVVGDVLERFRSVLQECFTDYRAATRSVARTLNFCTLLETPNVLRYEPASDEPDHFHEHSDAWNVQTATRQVSVIAYLNDVTVGGETVFPHLNHSQHCEKGKILLFPANFLYHHLAKAPESGPKAVVVTWIHFGNNGQLRVKATPLAGRAAVPAGKDGSAPGLVNT